MNDQFEQEIQEKGLTAPRVTLQRIEEIIVGEDYHVFPGTTTTIALLTLKNGSTVTGESVFVSLPHFDSEWGREIARDNAKQKIWALEEYAMRQKLHQS